MWLHVGEAAPEQGCGPIDGQPLVSTEPCASSTAWLTMFSDAISSITSRWRTCSSVMASAITGSMRSSAAVK
jgi:hypothetical protein